jgi:hypothetical protein
MLLWWLQKRVYTWPLKYGNVVAAEECEIKTSRPRDEFFLITFICDFVI